MTEVFGSDQVGANERGALEEGPVATHNLIPEELEIVAEAGRELRLMAYTAQRVRELLRLYMDGDEVLDPESEIMPGLISEILELYRNCPSAFMPNSGYRISLNPEANETTIALWIIRDAIQQKGLLTEKIEIGTTGRLEPGKLMERAVLRETIARALIGSPPTEVWANTVLLSGVIKSEWSMQRGVEKLVDPSIGILEKVDFVEAIIRRIEYMQMYVRKNTYWRDSFKKTAENPSGIIGGESKEGLLRGAAKDIATMLDALEIDSAPIRTKLHGRLDELAKACVEGYDEIINSYLRLSENLQAILDDIITGKSAHYVPAEPQPEN